MYIQTLFSKIFFCFFTFWKASINISIKNDEWGINEPISWTCRTQNISKNQNLYPQQSQITFVTLRWDTLYLVSRVKFNNHWSDCTCWNILISKWPRQPQKGLRRFSQKLTFWNQSVLTKNMRYVSAFS